MNLKKSKVIGVLVSLFFATINLEGKAFIPYIYQPITEDLEKASLDLGKTAAQLIHYNQTNDAKRIAELAVRLNPKDDRLWAVLAESQLRNNEITLATESLKKARILNPKKASLWFASGSLFLQQSNPKKAIQLINNGLKLAPENANAYFQLGNARIMQKQPSLALNAFKRASKIKPDFWEALNNQGLVLFEKNKTREAINIWRKVIKIQENAEPLLALASALNEVNPLNNESLELAKKSLALNPNYVSSKYQEGQLWGVKLQKATKKLFKNPKLLSDIERATANQTKN